MLFSELKKELGEGYNATGKIMQKINIKKYITFMERAALIDNIKVFAIKFNEENFKYIDIIDKKIYTILSVMVNLTDIKFENLYITNKENEEKILNIDVVLEICDYVSKNSLFDDIKNRIENYNEFIKELDFQLDQEIKISNSIEGVLNDKLNILINKIPDIDIEKTMKNLPNIINKIKPENLQFLKEVIKYNAAVDVKNINNKSKKT